MKALHLPVLACRQAFRCDISRESIILRLVAAVQHADVDGEEKPQALASNKPERSLVQVGVHRSTGACKRVHIVICLCVSSSAAVVQCQSCERREGERGRGREREREIMCVCVCESVCG